MTEVAHLEFRQSRKLQRVTRIADREHQSDALRPQPPRHKSQNLSRNTIEPLGGVHDTHQRVLLRHVRNETQDSQTDQEAIRGVAHLQAKRDPRRIALGNRQMVKAVQQRSAQLVYPGECQLHLRLDPGRSDDPKTRSAFHQQLQQGRLPNTGLAAQHQHTAVSTASTHQQPMQRVGLRLTPPQGLPITAPRQ